MKIAVTNSTLEALATLVNEMTGNPVESYARNAHGKLIANVGHYYVDYSLGGVSLYKIVNTSGDSDDVFSCGIVSKHGLADRMHAFLVGVEAGEK